MSTKLNIATNLAGDPVYFAFIDGNYVNFVPETPLTKAAPKLLEACKAISHLFYADMAPDYNYASGKMLMAHEIAKAAIAAAEGDHETPEA